MCVNELLMIQIWNCCGRGAVKGCLKAVDVGGKEGRGKGPLVSVYTCAMRFVLLVWLLCPLSLEEGNDKKE